MPAVEDAVCDMEIDYGHKAYDVRAYGCRQTFDREPAAYAG